MPSHFSLQQVNDFSRTETNCQIGEWKVILCRTGLSTIQETTDIPLGKPCRRTEALAVLNIKQLRSTDDCSCDRGPHYSSTRSCEALRPVE